MQKIFTNESYRLVMYRGNVIIGRLYVRAESRERAIEIGLQEWHELVSDEIPTKVSACKF